MADLRTLVRDEMERSGSPSYSFDDLGRRRDRKRRNQRIAAGVVGIAVFVAAVWILREATSLDGTRTVVPGGSGTTQPTESAPSGGVLSPGQPDVVRQRPCSGDARSRMELTQVGEDSSQVWIRVRFEVHGSPAGHRWRVAIRPGGVGGPHPGSPIFRGTRVASDLGRFAVQLRALDEMGSTFPNPFGALAVDTQTGEECRVGASIDP